MDAQALLFSANWLEEKRPYLRHRFHDHGSARLPAEITLDVDAAICPLSAELPAGDRADGVFITAGDAAGLFYGATTLWQLITMHALADFGNIVLPAVQIEDWLTHRSAASCSTSPRPRPRP